jgi:hypothetical protein
MASGAADPRPAGTPPQLGVQLVGGPTAILEYRGLRWLTDPADELGGNVVGMEPWSQTELESPRGGTVKVTAVHAQHGPDGSDGIQGPVIGFVLSASGAQAIYVSGNGIAERLLVLEPGQRAEV